MQLLQQNERDKTAFFDVGRDTSRASHFRDPNDGSIRPIAELAGFVTNSSFATNLPPSDGGKLPDPLPLPVMNFGPEDDEDDEDELEDVQNSEHLMIPRMQFGKPDKVQKAQISNGLPSPLPLPQMTFRSE